VSAPTITVDGDERLAATAREAADDLGDMTTTNRGVAEIAKARAAGNAPRITGRLAGSVRVASVTALEVVIAADAEYSAFVNYGVPSRGQVAQPFMTDALRDTQTEIVHAYASRVDSITHDIKGA
jgi:phage gpG-like protein